MVALRRTAVASIAALVLGWSALALADDKPPLKVGVLEDHSGDIAIFTMPKVHGAHLAVDEINAAGGILGRKVEITEYDPQFDNAKFQEFARRLIEKDKVEVIFGAATSASREAIRPIIDKDNALLFYAQQYEGGVCDGNMIGTGGLPEQQFSTLIPYMMEKFGKKVYIIAATISVRSRRNGRRSWSPRRVGKSSAPS